MLGGAETTWPSANPDDQRHQRGQGCGNQPENGHVDDPLSDPGEERGVALGRCHRAYWQ